MQPNVSHWFGRRTYAAAQWPPELLLSAKNATGNTSVGVVLPALNEAATVGAIVEVVRRELMERLPLVDELIVMDSGSTDETAAIAAAAGAKVVHREEVLPHVPVLPGKGEVMWRSLAATHSDIVVFVDADLREFRASFVTGLLGPLLTDSNVQFVKGMYDRPLANGTTLLPAGGGRVTEIVARPLVNLHWPQLAGFVQPLAGEYAARRELLEQVPFPCGYGVEIALLVDVFNLVGLDAMAQVDLGVRLHRNHPDHTLGRMASEVWLAALVRLDQDSVVRRLHPVATTLTQFIREGTQLHQQVTDVAAVERPPMRAVAGYIPRQARAS